MTNLIFDTLLTMDATGNVKAGLAKSWTVSPDGKDYAFTIRGGVKCHDGSAFDADAAKASIDRAIDPKTLNPNASAWGPISTISASGDVLTVKLKQPYVPFLSFLSNIQAAITCPSSLAGGKFTPIGTGPFKFVDWVRNDHIELAANPDYKNFNPLVDNPGAPHIDHLTLKVIPEAVARMAALRSGEVDMAEPSLQGVQDGLHGLAPLQRRCRQQVNAAATHRSRPPTAGGLAAGGHR